MQGSLLDHNPTEIQNTQWGSVTPTPMPYAHHFGSSPNPELNRAYPEWVRLVPGDEEELPSVDANPNKLQL